jgi:RimJ/RimL family protein N-acetyltransferase
MAIDLSLSVGVNVECRIAVHRVFHILNFSRKKLYKKMSEEKADTYKVLSAAEFSDGDILLRAVSISDIETIRLWRNSQMDVLRQKVEISAEQQVQYYSSHVFPERARIHPKQILFAIEKDRKLIGYGGFVHISWDDLRAEVSFLLDPTVERDVIAREKVFRQFLSIIKRIAFSDIGLFRLWTETYANRVSHIKSLELEGFCREGKLRSHNVIAQVPTDSLLHGILATEWKERL